MSTNLQARSPGHHSALTAPDSHHDYQLLRGNLTPVPIVIANATYCQIWSTEAQATTTSSIHVLETSLTVGEVADSQGPAVGSAGVDSSLPLCPLP